MEAVRGLGRERDAGEVGEGIAVAKSDGAALLNAEVEDFELAAADAGEHVAHAVVVAELGVFVSEAGIAGLLRPESRLFDPGGVGGDEHSAAGGSDDLVAVERERRRVCGFGYFDHQSSGLVAGTIYEYRITGHFNAQDLSGQIYQVHTIPSQTTLPDTFYIGNLRLTFGGPVAVVLDPPPDPAGLNAVSRRGISIAAKTSLPGWLGPSLDIWSVVIDLPQAVTSVIIETNASQQFQYAGGFAWGFSATPTPVPAGGLVGLSRPGGPAPRGGTGGA